MNLSFIYMLHQAFCIGDADSIIMLGFTLKSFVHPKNRFGKIFSSSWGRILMWGNRLDVRYSIAGMENLQQENSGVRFNAKADVYVATLE